MPLTSKLSPADFQRLQELFEQVTGLPDAERTEFLSQVELSEARVFAELKRMLACDEATLAPLQEDETFFRSKGVQQERNIDGYEILEEIGRGGMGVVYKARQLRPNRIVAIKMIRAGKFATPADVQRFAVEIDAIAKLEHDNIVPIYEIGSHHGEQFFTMQLIEGIPFDRYLASPEFEQQDALRILERICDAVAYCHAHGVIHRDLKPSNVLMGEHRSPKLMDFGLAKHLESDSNLTRAGELMGTPGFMAPEQADASSDRIVDARADIYSIGAILYMILTGRAPIDVDGVNLAGAIEKIGVNDIVPPRSIDRRIPRDLETICMKCLELLPEKRYQNAAEVAEELRRFRDGEPIVATPLSRPHRLLRWARLHPGLAATWAIVVTFYIYHLSVYFNSEVQGYYRQPLFHWVATTTAVIYLVGAHAFQHLLVRTNGARWPLFCWVTMEVALLTVLLAAGNAGDSILVVLYPVLVAASVLRFQPIVVAYVTILCLLCYASQVWWANFRFHSRTTTGDLDEVMLTNWFPVGLAILSTGLIQYFALRRSQKAIEFVGSKNQ